jgi:hypothetical protein
MAKEQTLHVVPESSMERFKATWLHRILSLAAPWAVALAVVIAAAPARAAWGGRGGGTVAAVAGLAAAAAVVAAAAWHAARHRPVLLRAHSAATAAAGGGWLCLAMVTGPGQHVTAYLGMLLAVTACLTWNFRRWHVPPQPDSTAATKVADLFADAAEPAGVKGAKLTVTNVGARKIEGVAHLVPGEHTAPDFVRKLGNLESGMRLPPGSLTAVDHPDRADLAKVTLTDPRLMRQPVPWPGPSRPGASIAEPICPGLWQDADPVLWTITGHHVQAMGMTGSGKSVGGGWSYLGETITREETAVLAADITKGDQTLGPLRPALHQFADDMPKIRAQIADVRAIIRPRTDYLASRGLQRWERGCGLSYLIWWWEEAPDILDQLSEKQMETLVSIVRAMRSAGMTWVVSLQRSTYDQIPTILRGQTANWCFGVQNSADARYGLSERQDDGGANPALWQNAQPGMAYLDTPGTPDDRITMPMRCWYWGPDNTVMAAHAAQFPATARPLDPLTARLLADAAAARAASAPRAAAAAPARPAVTAAPARPDDDEDQDDEDQARYPEAAFVLESDDLDEDQDQEDPEAVQAEYLTEPDPDPELTAGIDDPIELPDDDLFAELEFPAGDRMDPAEARELFRKQLENWQDEGRQEFTTSDLYPLLETTGLSRAWLHKQINAAIEDDLIEPVTDGERGRFGRYALCEPSSDAAA